MSEAFDEFLAHHGVKGMKWGQRKADDGSPPQPKKPKKELTPEQKAFRRKIVSSAVQVGAAVAIKRGARWALENPDKIANFATRVNNVRNGTKAIGPGYNVVKMTLSSAGVYK